MATFRPFQCVRPRTDLASQIAALPYDVYNRQESRAVVEAQPMSFLKIDRAETLFPEDTGMYSQQVYDKASAVLNEMIEDGSFVQDSDCAYYLYELTMDGRTQTGLVGCASIDDYLTGTIKKHENTRADKEKDRIRHVDTLSAQTGPIFLACRARQELTDIFHTIQSTETLYDFVSEDGIKHRVWKIVDPELTTRIQALFADTQALYIADGHHRAASAVKVGLKRREEHPDYTGNEEFNYFLSVVFPSNELKILDYNRVVADLNGHSFTDFLTLLERDFNIEPTGNEPVKPAHKGEFALYVDGKWYHLEAKDSLLSQDPVDGLDVSILQNTVLGPLLNITDPKIDPRIAFVGGIRGIHALQEMVNDAGDGVAFALYPTAMDELFQVADAGLLMPPKSTWFEPKLRSGLFIHQI